MLQIQREELNGKLVFRLSGNFDGEAVQHLQSLLSDATGEVVLDFSQVQDFFDLALASLWAVLQKRKVHIRGLRLHQERMFRYFGLQEPHQNMPPRAYYTPEEAVLA